MNTAIEKQKLLDDLQNVVKQVSIRAISCCKMDPLFLDCSVRSDSREGQSWQQSTMSES